MMEPFRATRFAREDIISSIPKNLIAAILERMPIRDAVKTSTLSRSWRFNWTFITQLVFDQKFFQYFHEKQQISQHGAIIYRILLHLEGCIAKCKFHIPDCCRMRVDDISHWIWLLSRKGMEEFTLVNMNYEPLVLPSHLFNCLELKYLKLRNCHLHRSPDFNGFPNLVNYEFSQVIFESKACGEFVAGCPLLETLTIRDHTVTGNVKPFQIAKLQNLKILRLSLSKLDILAVTISDVIQLARSFPKLEELCLYFEKGKFLAESGARRRVRTTYGRLKTLKLYGIDFYNCDMVLCAFGLIGGCMNLQRLEITASNKKRVSPPAFLSWEEHCTMGLLKSVSLNSFEGLKTELSLIKFLLACSPSLKKMIVNLKGSVTDDGYHGAFMIATELLKFNRASTNAEIELC